MQSRREKAAKSKDAPAKDEAFIVYGAVMILQHVLRRQSMHQHRPFEMIAALDGQFRCKFASGEIIETTKLVVPSMVPHAPLGCDGRLARVYVDPGMRRVISWRQQKTLEGTDGNAILSKIRLFFESDRSLQKAKTLINDWRAAWMGALNSAPLCDSRVIAVLDFLNDQALPTANRESVAKQAGLSPSRLAAIFAAETGMPLRRYINWRRTLLAGRLIREGQTVTQAALQAGFADNAHFTRSYRATIGSPPSDLKSVKIVQPTSRRHHADPDS